MSDWLLRGLSMTVVHVLARVLLGVAVVGAPLQTTLWQTLAIAGVILVAVIWGMVDGMNDARRHPDPDDYADLTVRWLKAGIVAGVLAAIICWVLGRFFFAGIGQAGIVVEIFAGGSFTALLVFFSAFVGAAAGRWIIRREQNKAAVSEETTAGRDDAQSSTAPEGVSPAMAE